MAEISESEAFRSVWTSFETELNALGVPETSATSDAPARQRATHTAHSDVIAHTPHA